MVNLLVLIILDQLLLKLKILKTFSTKQPTLMRRSNVLSLSTHLAFPGFTLQVNIFDHNSVAFRFPVRVQCYKTFYRRNLRFFIIS
jgi:hypothetical protein